MEYIKGTTKAAVLPFGENMTLTRMIITAAIIILGVYDLFAVFWGGVDSTISRVMQDAGMKSPTVSFVLGYICGHILGYMPPKCPNCHSNEHKSP